MVRQNRARLDRCLLPSTGLRLWRGEVLPGVDEPVASIAALLVATAVQIGGYLRAARTSVAPHSVGTAKIGVTALPGPGCLVVMATVNPS